MNPLTSACGLSLPVAETPPALTRRLNNDLVAGRAISIVVDGREVATAELFNGGSGFMWRALEEEPPA